MPQAPRWLSRARESYIHRTRGADRRIDYGSAANHAVGRQMLDGVQWLKMVEEATPCPGLPWMRRPGLLLK